MGKNGRGNVKKLKETTPRIINRPNGAYRRGVQKGGEGKEQQRGKLTRKPSEGGEYLSHVLSCLYRSTSWEQGGGRVRTVGKWLGKKKAHYGGSANLKPYFCCPASDHGTRH